jgi:hypothetical protein
MESEIRERRQSLPATTVLDFDSIPTVTHNVTNLDDGPEDGPTPPSQSTKPTSSFGRKKTVSDAVLDVDTISSPAILPDGLNEKTPEQTAKYVSESKLDVTVLSNTMGSSPSTPTLKASSFSPLSLFSVLKKKDPSTETTTITPSTPSLDSPGVESPATPSHKKASSFSRISLFSVLKKKDPSTETTTITPSTPSLDSPGVESPATPAIFKKAKKGGVLKEKIMISSPVMIGPPPKLSTMSLEDAQKIKESRQPSPPPSEHSVIEKIKVQKTDDKRIELLESQVKELQMSLDELLKDNKKYRILFENLTQKDNLTDP